MIKVMPEKRKPTEAAKPAQAAEQPAPKKTGRPSLYNQQLAAQICTRISNGESLRNICREAGMPHMDTIYVWLGKHPVFADQYARAREEQADTLG
jgi:hypothetical protein